VGGILRAKHFFCVVHGNSIVNISSPGIARILMDLELLNTDMGMIIIGAATVNDLVGWSLFAFILSNFAPNSIINISPYMTFILVLLMFVFMLTIGRVLAQIALTWLKSHMPWRDLSWNNDNPYIVDFSFF